MMRRTLFAFAAALALAASGAEAQTRPSFVADGSLDVCTTAGFAPMTYKRNPGDERPVGFDVELADALGARWGVPVRFLVTDFPGLLPALSAQRCDLVISGIFITDQRRQTFDGVPYVQTTTVLLTARANTTIRGPEDLAGQTVAIEAGTVYERMANSLNEEFQRAGRRAMTIQTYSRFELLQALLLKSPNDVAGALARDNAGSPDEFVAKMNRRARAMALPAWRWRPAST
jgi:polar amino acid transport system substrate-binding protein